MNKIESTTSTKESIIKMASPFSKAPAVMSFTIIFHAELSTYFQILTTLNVSDITWNFHTVPIFVIINF
jgi:hypothetical protein